MIDDSSMDTNLKILLSVKEGATERRTDGATDTSAFRDAMDVSKNCNDMHTVILSITSANGWTMFFSYTDATDASEKIFSSRFGNFFISIIDRWTDQWMDTQTDKQMDARTFDHKQMRLPHLKTIVVKIIFKRTFCVTLRLVT